MSLVDDDRDPYAVEGVPRGVVKRWVTVTLGKGSPPRKWKAADSEKLARKSGIDLAAYPVDGVTAAILARHPVLNDLSGLPATVLQYQESEVIVAAMLRRKTEPTEFPFCPSTTASSSRMSGAGRRRWR